MALPFIGRWYEVYITASASNPPISPSRCASQSTHSSLQAGNSHYAKITPTDSSILRTTLFVPAALPASFIELD